MPEIRCEFRKHGEVSLGAKGIYERICDSRFCKIDNEIVLHRWNLEKLNANGTVKLIETKRLKRPVVKGIKK